MWHIFWILCPQTEKKVTDSVESRYLLSYSTSLSCCQWVFNRKCSGINVSTWGEIHFLVESHMKKLYFLSRGDWKTPPSLYHKEKTDHPKTQTANKKQIPLIRKKRCSTQETQPHHFWTVKREPLRNLMLVLLWRTFDKLYMMTKIKSLHIKPWLSQASSKLE